jgi:four helix bundle protein
MTIRSYRDLIVWQKALELATDVYRLTMNLPSHETYGLASQLQRAAVSVPSNIAEGQARLHPAEFRQFLYHALGSLAEVDTQLLLAQNLGYLRPDSTMHAESLIIELRKMMHTLASRLPGRQSRQLTTHH